MLPDARYVTVEDAAKQIKVQPITLRRWLGIGTMPHVEVEGTGYVLQADVARLQRGVPVQEPEGL